MVKHWNDAFLDQVSRLTSHPRNELPRQHEQKQKVILVHINLQGAQIDHLCSLFFLQTFSWGKTHESFWCAWGFFLKDDDDAVVRNLNVLGCFITGGCSGLSSVDPLVCSSLVLRCRSFGLLFACAAFLFFFLCVFVSCCCLSTCILVCFIKVYFFLLCVVLSVNSGLIQYSTCLGPLLDRPLTGA